MKKFYSTLAVACAIGVAAAAFADIPALSKADTTELKQTRMGKVRPERKPREPREAVSITPRRAQATDKALYGIVYANDFSETLFSHGIARVDFDYNFELVGDFESGIETMNGAQAGCYIGDGKYLMNAYYDTGMSIDGNIRYSIYDTNSWECLNSVEYTSNNTDHAACDLTYDPVSGRVYGIFGYGEWNIFGYYNYDDVLNGVTKVATLDKKILALASDKEGTIYGFNEDSELCTINKMNGELTVVGAPNFEVGYAPYYLPYQSAVVEWESGDIYYATIDDMLDTYLYKVTPSTLETECILNLSYESGGTGTDEEFTGLFFIQEGETDDTVPATASDLQVTLNGTELTAAVSFTMPAATVGGAALEGDLSYTIGDGTNELATGTAAAGAAVNENITVAESGAYQISVIVKDAAGKESQPTYVSTYIGCDVPAVASVTARAVKGDVNVSWTAATGAHEGNLGEVTYKVVRTPGDVVVAEATTETSVLDVIDNDVLTEYVYTVTPSSNGVAGEAVSSRKVWGGTYHALPFEEDFSNESRFNNYPVIDANNDASTWYFGRMEGVYAGMNNQANDYLCFGPFNIEEGMEYTVILKAGVHTNPETLAIYYGNDPDDAASFSTELVEPTEFSNYEREFRGVLTATASEKGYFAVRAMSDANGQSIYLYNLKVVCVTGAMPEAVTGLVQRPLAKGTAIECVLPEKTIDGTAAAAVIAVNVYRAEELIATVSEGVADGAKFSYTDDYDFEGNVAYTVAAVNAYGEGRRAQLDAYLGLDYPAAPRNFHAVEDLETPGLIHFTWEAPEVGVNGGYINPAELEYYYNMYGQGFSVDGSDYKVNGNVCKLDLTFDPVPEKECIITGTLWAQNSLGQYPYLSRVNTVTSAYIGGLNKMPIRESWPGGAQSGEGRWRGTNIDDNAESFSSSCYSTAGYYSGKSAQDGDGGMMGYNTSVAGGGYVLYSPRFDLTGTTKPTAIFYLNYAMATQMLKVDVLADEEIAETIDVAITEAGADKWTRYTVDLAPYIGKKRVQLVFSARGAEPMEEYALLDNVAFVDMVDKDIEVTGIVATDKCDVNSKASFTIGLLNGGASAVNAGDYQVKLYKNGAEVAAVDGVAIPLDKSNSMTLSYTTNVFDAGTAVFYAEVVYEGDARPENNKSGEASVEVVATEYPGVTDLVAEATPSEIVLSWSDPDLSGMPNVPTVESFENYENWIIEGYGDWTNYDGDGLKTPVPAISFFGSAWPADYDHVGEPMAWQIINPSATIIGSWYAHSGSKLIAAFQASDNGNRSVDSEDWLISPELSGNAQTVSFFATASDANYAPETIEIYYSTTGNSVEDFQANKVTTLEIPRASQREWPEFTVELPEGAKYFAMVHVSNGKFAVFVDDITYEHKGAAPEKIELQGFNVYRDGKLIVDEPVVDTEYVDSNVENGVSYTYNVTAVWDKGESKPSNAFVLSATSVANVSANSAVSIAAVEGAVRVSGANGETAYVYAPSGACVAAQTVVGTSDIPVAAGIYIVRVGQTSAKLVVR